MNIYTEENFENNLYKVKYIEGEQASASARPTYHENRRLIISNCVKGGGSIIIDNKRYKLSDGDLIIIKPKEFFCQHIDDRCFHKRIVLIIDTKILQSLPKSCFSVMIPFFQRKNSTKSHIPSHLVKELHIDRMFKEVLDYLKEGSENASMMAFARVLEIVAATNKISTESQLYKDANLMSNSRINDILEYLNSNYTKDISVTQVAERFYLDRSYMSRLFKEQIGIGMWDYVIMKRIHLFNYLIIDNDTLEETAYKAGFKNYSNFYRLYKKYMKVTPMEFKKSL